MPLLLLWILIFIFILLWSKYIFLLAVKNKVFLMHTGPNQINRFPFVLNFLIQVIKIVLCLGRTTEGWLIQRVVPRG